jgi:hypothetical protein
MFPIISYGWGAIRANGFWPLLDLLVIFCFSVARDFFQNLMIERGKQMSDLQRNVENLFVLLALFYAWEVIPASFGHGRVVYEIIDAFFFFLMFYLHDRAQALERKMKFKPIWQWGSILSIVAIMVYVVFRRTIP